MKESYGEGIAIHAGPESCGDSREGSAEASTGVRAGRVYSRERIFLRGADAVRRSGRPHRTRRQRETRTGPARSETLRTHTESPCTGTGRSQSCPRQMEPRDASGSRKAYADDARLWEVGQPRSTEEAAERGRATDRGGGGGKAAEPKGTRASKTQPGHRVGQLRRVRWSGYGKSRNGTRRCGSQRSCTTSTT